jgi:hypothetical protein
MNRARMMMSGYGQAIAPRFAIIASSLQQKRADP